MEKEAQGLSILMKAISYFLTLNLTVAGWFGLLPQQTLRADVSKQYQIHEGFGTSTAWWAQTVDDEALARNIAELLWNKESGLGLDIFRYNVGGGSKENPDSRIVIENRKTESFYVRDDSEGKFVYDFSRDANARRIMDLAVKNGAKKIILFCNSPHWSMTVNGLASGSETEGESNLAPENYDLFVDYLLTIAEHFIDAGYPIYGISPINEPQWNWGTGWVSQEGCHYSPAEAVALLERFALEIQRRGLNIRLLGPESGQMDWRYVEYEEAFYNSEILRSFCDTFSGHSYWMDGNDGQKIFMAERFHEKYNDLKFEMSEWCELPQELDPQTIESGLRMANVMYEDLALMNAVSWQSWTAVNGDGLLDLKDGALVKYKRYAVYKQFSVIPVGARRVGVLDSLFGKSTLRTLCYTNGGNTYFVIINNEENAKKIQIKGSGMKAEVYVTSADKDFEPVISGRFNGKLTLEPQSVTTVILHRNNMC